MKTKHLLLVGLLAVASAAVTFGQTPYQCEGCPALADRDTLRASDISDGTGSLLVDNTVIGCDKLVILDRKLYVDSNQVLTILPGTVIKAAEDPNFNTPSADASALIVTRYGKIYANGTECCPIVFTTVLDPMDGTYPLYTQSKWGGVIILGRSHNTVGEGEFNPENPNFEISPGGPGSKGIGIIEGVSTSDKRHYYGMRLSAPYNEDFIPEDNSGSLRYVSIRHGGAQLGTANEINGLTLGSVGYGTTFRNIEIIGNFDDGIEFFGGSAEMKYVRLLYIGDDYLDWDQGFTGRIQHVIGVQHIVNPDNPPYSQPGFSGMECDGDDGTSYAREWLSDPTVANVTIIGNDTIGKDRGLRLKERTKGEIYNTILTNFYRSVDGATGADSVVIRNSTFVNSYSADVNGTFPYGPAFDGLPYHPSTDSVPSNTYPSTLGGVTYGRWYPSPGYWSAVPLTTGAAFDFATNTENPAKQGRGWYSDDNYYDWFDNVDYQGAFKPGDKVWWSMDECHALGDYNSLESSSSNLSRPSDINHDGITNSGDLGIVLGRFGLTNDQ